FRRSALRLPGCLVPQRLHVGPELLPLRALVGGQFLQRLLAADGGEVRVLLPVGELRAYPGAVLRLPPREHVRPGVEVGAEPGEGLAAEAGALPGVELAGLLPLAGGGQGGGAGSLVAVAPGLRRQLQETAERRDGVRVLLLLHQRVAETGMATTEAV